MRYYRVRNKKGQIAAEISDNGLSVHDQTLSGNLHQMKQEGGIPLANGTGRAWTTDAILNFVKENGYTVEVKED